MPKPFITTRRVEFRDTDAAGIMHFSAFIFMMEQAEHDFLRSLGLSVMMHDADGAFSWPRVSVNCDFRQAVVFEDIVEIEVTVQKLGGKSITYGFAFRHDGQPIASGSLTAVCCRVAPHTRPHSIAIPAEIREKLAAWL